MSEKVADKSTAKSGTDKVVSDYNGYDYKTDFWENTGREYEDQADRMAIRKLLPKRMEKFADIGGGYGRLANESLTIPRPSSQKPKKSTATK